MKLRSINRIEPSQKVNMGGNILDQPLPSRKTDMLDPFLLIHHWAETMPGGQKQQNVGVGPHPHRGFAPVSFIFEGGVHHRDSLGTESIIYKGGTQWMNSGYGIVHSERPPKELAEKGGFVEFIQFWVNSPAKHKMDSAKYQPLTNEDTPKVYSDDQLVEVGVVAGELEGQKGPIDVDNPLLTLRLVGKKGGKKTVSIPSNYNALLYPLNGGMTINGETAVNANDMVVFTLDGEGVDLEFSEDATAILLCGEPINEPVATYGPFVMNSQSEIMEAIKDYQEGKLGELEENFS